MQRNIIDIYKSKSGGYRTTLKTLHGRKIFLAVQVNNGVCDLTECWYLDRNVGKEGDARKSAKPLKLKSTSFEYTEERMLNILRTELDTIGYGVRFIENSGYMELSDEEFISVLSGKTYEKRRYLILIYKGNRTGGDIPDEFETILRNKVHRTIYLKIVACEKNGIKTGKMVDCHYLDTRSRMTGDIRKGVVSRYGLPQSVTDFVMTFNRKEILRFVNSQLSCDFERVLFVNSNDLDLSDKRPICGSIL